MRTHSTCTDINPLHCTSIYVIHHANEVKSSITRINEEVENDDEQERFAKFRSSTNPIIEKPSRLKLNLQSDNRNVIHEESFGADIQNNSFDLTPPSRN